MIKNCSRPVLGWRTHTRVWATSRKLEVLGEQQTILERQIDECPDVEVGDKELLQEELTYTYTNSAEYYRDSYDIPKALECWRKAVKSEYFELGIFFYYTITLGTCTLPEEEKQKELSQLSNFLQTLLDPDVGNRLTRYLHFNKWIHDSQPNSIYSVFKDSTEPAI